MHNADLKERLRHLDHLTVAIDRLADGFGVTWQAAALRAVSLGLISIEELDEIKDLARQERAARILGAG